VPPLSEVLREALPYGLRERRHRRRSTTRCGPRSSRAWASSTVTTAAEATRDRSACRTRHRPPGALRPVKTTGAPRRPALHRPSLLRAARRQAPARLLTCRPPAGGVADRWRGRIPPVRDLHFTTPEATEVQAHLAAARDAGVRVAVVESSSHGASLQRLADVATRSWRGPTSVARAPRPPRQLRGVPRREGGLVRRRRHRGAEPRRRGVRGTSRRRPSAAHDLRARPEADVRAEDVVASADRALLRARHRRRSPPPSCR
jgi:hypothetical protein